MDAGTDRIPVQLLGSLLDRGVYASYLQASGEITVVEEGSGVRLLLSDEPEWLNQLGDEGTLDCSRVVIITGGDPERLRPAVDCGIEVIVGRAEPPEALLAAIHYAA